MTESKILHGRSSSRRFSFWILFSPLLLRLGCTQASAREAENAEQSMEQAVNSRNVFMAGRLEFGGLATARGVRWLLRSAATSLPLPAGILGA